MHETLQSKLSPEALKILNSVQTIEEDTTTKLETYRQPSLKERPYYDYLATRPDLAVAIEDTMGMLRMQDRSLPVFHITSREIRLSDGTTQSTGYLENIMENGLRPMDTNVAGLVERHGTTRMAEPEDYERDPALFVHAMSGVLSRYMHHGSRTNKASLAESRDQGKGVPVMLVVRQPDNSLIKGSDYDDHFKLATTVPPTDIIGAIDLEGLDIKNLNDISEVAEQVLEALRRPVS